MSDAVLNGNSNDRLNRLERKLRWLRLGVIALACLVAALVAILTVGRIRVPANVVARGFSLVDESGNVLAHLARTSAGGVLVLESRSGSEKVFLGMLDKAAGLSLLVRDRERTSLTVGDDGSPVLTMRDAEGRARMMAGLDAEDLPSISLWNEKRRLDFLARPGYSPMLQVFDGDGSSLFAVRPKKPRPARETPARTPKAPTEKAPEAPKAQSPKGTPGTPERENPREPRPRAIR